MEVKNEYGQPGATPGGMPDHPYPPPFLEDENTSGCGR